VAVSAGGKEINRTVHGTTSDFAFLRTQVPQLGGRFLDADDDRLGRKVAFIGWKVANDLFGSQDAVGRTSSSIASLHRHRRSPEEDPGLDVQRPGRRPGLPAVPDLRADRQPAFLDQIHMQPREASQSTLIEERVKALLGRKYRFDPKDRYATTFWNTIEDFKQGQAIFKGIEIFLGVMAR